MAVQVSYPGVYIEEFAPGAPIEGVGTSTAAFIGVASKGPIEDPVLIQSWDTFVEVFGGFIADPPTGFLAAAVYGFFRNGGTSVYVVRAGSGKQSEVGLTSRASGPPTPVLTATAVEEGPVGDKLTIQVTESSNFAMMMTDAGLGATTLEPAFASTNIVSVNAARDTLVLGSNADFAVDDRVHFRKGTDNQTGIVRALSGTDTIVLTGPIPGAVDFSAGTAFLENFVKGRKSVRLAVDPAISLSEALPPGTVVTIADGVQTEVATVASSGGDVLTLSSGLVNDYDTDTAASLPVVASLEFNMAVTDTGTGKSETYELLGMNPSHPRYWQTAVTSPWITLEEVEPPPSVADLRPVAGLYTLAGGIADNRATAWGQVQTTPDKYLDLLRPIDEVNIVAVPGATATKPQQAVRDHCVSMGDRFGVLDGVQDMTPGFTDLKLQFANVRTDRGHVALYYPWILAGNPVTGKDELLPPSGHIAGIYARTDQERGVHKAPANTNIRNAIGLQRRLTDAQQGPLNISGINILRIFPTSAQPIVWGARTTATDRNWQYVNVRRLFLFLIESIEEGINWAVFEPNNLQLWKKLRRSINEFLERVWRDGALFGETAEKAFYVRIDEVLNPPASMALGRLVIEIGVRPVYPAEFVVVRIGIWQGGSEITES